MLSMALELSRYDPAYEDIASKFFEHFVDIADAMNTIGGTGLWDEEDGFYYDQMYVDRPPHPAASSLDGRADPALRGARCSSDEAIGGLPGFQKRMDWFLTYRPDLARHISYMETTRRERLTGPSPAGHSLARAAGARAALRARRERVPLALRHPLLVQARTGTTPTSSAATVRSSGSSTFPANRATSLFGGNSNWRGPIWFPVNYLLIEALERYHHFYGDSLRVECPTGSGRWMNLAEVAQELASRLVKLFLPDQQGRRPCQSGAPGARPFPTATTSCCFTSISTGRPGLGLGPATRRDGRVWSLTAFGRPFMEEHVGDERNASLQPPFRCGPAACLLQPAAGSGTLRVARSNRN